ncbi:cytochrome P450 [Thelephora terrestris]|uniref:Cytochrome P450 n=1 Tax=Thelephora terrestris TaxID=56493 RepID=A0A9P6HI91_9AGAM|nr:cytochrome P450 [Thelephora terrestris]
MGWITKLVTVVAAVSLACLLYRKQRRSSISDIRGPDDCASFLLGHLKFLWHAESGVIEDRLLKEYGSVVRIKGPLSEGRLWVADPKALHQILQATSGLYVKLPIRRETTSIVTDKGLLCVEGEAHRRQRKAMMPAFGLTTSREYLPRFIEVIEKLDGMWKDICLNAPDGVPVTLDIAEWLGRAALDMIGKAVFEYEFGALDRLDNPITTTYLNLVNAAFGTKPPPVNLFVSDVAQYFPPGILSWLFERDQTPGPVKLRENRKQVHAVARTLIDAKREDMRNGDQGKDVLSLLIKGGDEADETLEDYEIIAQVRTLMFAGHEASSKTMAYILWELAKNPEVQTKLRAELDANVSAKGKIDFSAVELENMPYLNAVIKETLRMHSSLTDIIRQASEDNVLPLSTPVVGSSGRTYQELHIPKGTIVHASTSGYNINPDVWGSDAQVFRPERWLEQDLSSVKTPLGVYGNMLTFSAGVRSCVGWRFAIIQLQALVARVVREFQFFEVEDKPVTLWRPGLVVPIVAGEEAKGPQLPLKVSLVHRN